MEIVVLDGYTLNPGDLSWQPLHNMGNLQVYDRTPEALIVERAAHAHIIFTNKTPLSGAIIERLPNLKYIGVLATGYDQVDVQTARKLGITVTNVPGYGVSSVAQMVFALLLGLCNHVQLHSESVKQGDWTSNPDFSYWKTPLVELAGKTLGIIGYGDIGRKVADIGRAFGMQIIANKRNPGPILPFEQFRWGSYEEILKEADVVTLHCPLSTETEGMINSNSLALMKSTAFLINTARGKLIKEQDLADALNEGIIAGAGLDVLSVEPPSSTNPLLSAKNCLITPHMAWATKESRQRLLDIAVSNVESFLRGEPTHVVG